MDLQQFAHIPIIIAMVLIAIGIFIGSMNIQNSELSNFISSSQQLTEKAKGIREAMEERTTEKGLTGLIEDIPIFGNIVKAGRFLASIISTIRDSIDLFLSFIKDSLNQKVFQIPSEITILLLTGIFITFGFSVYRAIKGG